MKNSAANEMANSTKASTVVRRASFLLFALTIVSLLPLPEWAYIVLLATGCVAFVAAVWRVRLIDGAGHDA